MSDINQAAPPPTSFLQFIASHSNGFALDLLTQKVKEIVEHMETLATNEGQSKSKSTLSIKITFAREDGIYKIGIEPSVKLQSSAPPKTVYWATAAHGLVQQDPRQMNLPMREVGRRIVRVFDTTHTPSEGAGD
jgi:hypothetical protein